MSIKDKAKKVMNDLQRTEKEEDYVFEDTKHAETHEEVKEVLQEQERVIKHTKNVEKELLILLTKDTSHLISKTRELVDWEKEITAQFDAILQEKELEKIVKFIQNQEWQKLEETEIQLSQRLKTIENERNEITKELSEQDLEIIEYLLDENTIVNEIEELKNLVEEEMEEEKMLENKLDNRQVEKQEREVQQIMENFQTLGELKNDIVVLQNRKQEIANQAYGDLKKIQTRVRKAKKTIPKDKEAYPHEFRLTETMLTDLDNITKQLLNKNSGGNNPTRRDFIKMGAAALLTLSYGKVMIKEMREFENEVGESIEEAEKELEQEIQESEDPEKHKGDLNSNQHPFKIQHTVKEIDDERVAELKIHNPTNTSLKTRVSYKWETGVYCTGVTGIDQGTQSNMIGERIVDPGEVYESGVSLVLNQNRELLEIDIMYSVDGEDWNTFKGEISLNGRDVEELVLAEETVEEKGFPVKFEYRSVASSLENNEFVNLEVIGYGKEKSETEFSVRVPQNWNITGAQRFSSIQDNRAETTEVYLDGAKNVENDKFGLKTNNRKITRLNLQKGSEGQNTIELIAHSKSETGKDKIVRKLPIK